MQCIFDILNIVNEYGHVILHADESWFQLILRCNYVCDFYGAILWKKQWYTCTCIVLHIGHACQHFENAVTVNLTIHGHGKD